MTASVASTVIVVSYRPGTWLRPCLESAAGQATEVIVVDNGSAGSRATALAEECRVRSVRLGKNAGFTGGVAAGLAQARGELIAVLNDDAVAAPGWLDSAAAVLADPEVGAVTPKVVLHELFAEVVLADPVFHAPPDPRPLGRQVRSITVAGREVLDRALGAGLHELEPAAGDRWRWTAGPQPFYVPLPDGGGDAVVAVDGERVTTGRPVRLVNHAGSFLRGHGIAGEYGLGAPDDGRFDLPAERFGFSGTAPVFRAETLARLGAFAGPFFAYNEDTDWCLRARMAGLRIMYDPGGTVEHRLSATSGGQGRELVRHLSQRNALLCLVRNAPAAVAARHVAGRLRHSRSDWVARHFAARLPWALASRAHLARGRVLRPAEVWARWADQDMAWDGSAARRPS